MVSCSSDFGTRSFRTDNNVLTFRWFSEDNMSDPRLSTRTLYCLCCGKYICKKVGTRSKEDSKRFRASRSLKPEFIVSGLLLPFILHGVEVVTGFQIFDFIQGVIPDNVMPAAEKVLLKEIDQSTTADLM